MTVLLRWSLMAAHPRSRGENASGIECDVLYFGSSPLTRGKHGGHEFRERICRLIPAHAGKTMILLSRRFWRRAHPRSRGENVDDARVFGEYNGSSPLTRGKRASSPTHETAAGLIPAHAGKTDPIGGMACSMRAHPRSRGENVREMRFLTPGEGSSPLTRGKQVGAGFRRLRDRLIPAHAGKTAQARRDA